MQKVKKSQVMCVVLGITVFLGGTFVENRSPGLQDGNMIARNSYGQGEKEQEVMVDGLLGKKVPVVVSMRERQYQKQEAEAVFTPAYEALTALILGDNTSLDEVKTDLQLLTWLEEYGLAVDWSCDNWDIVDTSGRVNNEDCPEEGTKIYLTACLRAGGYSDEYILPVRVLPPVRTAEEARIAAFKKELTLLDAQQEMTEHLELPGEYLGKTIRYSVRGEGDYWLFPILGAAAAILIPLRERQNLQEQKKKRERQLLLDYSDIVSKLVVFLGAGLPIRKAWEKIVHDYEENVQVPNDCRYAYEEMKNAYYLMGRGVAETKAYAEFGNRCRILPYRKLAGILEQNVKNGTENLRSVLEAEMREAFEQRKTLARRMGEEAGTKLLLPLFMMLAVVMVMISVPAFLSFGM